MGDCLFSEADFKELRDLMMNNHCNPPGRDRSCITHEGSGRDYCLDACDIVQKYGNGFSFYTLMKRISAETRKNFTSCFPTGRYGAGANGLVLRVTCSTKDIDFHHYAMKITKFDNRRRDTPYNFFNEVKMQNKFYMEGLAPKILFSDMYEKDRCTNSVGVIVMEPISDTYSTVIRRSDRVLRDPGSSRSNIDTAKSTRKRHAANIGKMVSDMKRLGLTHGDMHSQNIAFMSTPSGSRMVLIDFGRSTDFYPNPVLDLAAAANSDMYISPYLSKEISSTGIPGKADLYDAKFLGLIQNNVLCEIPGRGVGELLRYKIFMSQILPHLEVLEGVYREMKRSDESTYQDRKRRCNPEDVFGDDELEEGEVVGTKRIR